jgi:hypothetical protein
LRLRCRFSSGFGEQRELVDVRLKLAELILRRFAVCHDAHQGFEVLVGCGSLGEHLDDGVAAFRLCWSCWSCGSCGSCGRW